MPTFLNDVNLNGNKLLSALLEKLSGDPSGVEARIFYHDGENLVKFYNGAEWVTLGRLDQMTPPTAEVDLGSQRIINLNNPTELTDATPKDYVDGQISTEATNRDLAIENAINSMPPVDSDDPAYAIFQTIDGVTLWIPIDIAKATDLANHIGDALAAHAATAISVADPFLILDNDNVEVCLWELKQDFNGLPTLASSDTDVLPQPVAVSGVMTLDVSNIAGVKNAYMVVRGYSAGNIAGTYVTPAGSFGEGSYLEATTNAAMPAIDGLTLALNDKVLVNGQTELGQNGVYYATNLGSGSTKWRLTRVPWLHTPSQFMKGLKVSVAEGNVYTGTTLQLTTIPANVNGTDDIKFTEMPLAGGGLNGGVRGANILGAPGVIWGTGGPLALYSDADTLRFFNAIGVNGLTGATAANRQAGATTGGSPTTGTWIVGDEITDHLGYKWICVVAGTGTAAKWMVLGRDSSDIWGPPPVGGTRKGQTHADIASCSSSRAMTAGNLYLAKVPMPRNPGAISNVFYERSGQATSPANCYVSAYSSAGVKLAQSADLSTTWDDATTGVANSVALSFTPTWDGPDSYWYVGFFIGSGTGMALRAGGNALPNVAFPSGGPRFTVNTGLGNIATMPTPITIGSLTPAGTMIAAVMT